MGNVQAANPVTPLLWFGVVTILLFTLSFHPFRMRME